jgi:2-C-methyl-D-erythritol 4-phosphate cytidylyltransferase
MNAAVIVAGGVSRRMGGAVNKLLLELEGLPVLGHTWRRFDSAPGIDEIVIVNSEMDDGELQSLASQLSLKKPWHRAASGAERQDSVWNGLQSVAVACELVAIQDGARPCTSLDTIAATLEAASVTGAAVAASKVTDTLKEAGTNNQIACTIDREKLWAVQTPQVFRRGIIVRALEAVRDQGLNITDDTAACELIGQPVRLVASDTPNPKVTTPSDLPLIASLLR